MKSQCLLIIDFWMLCALSEIYMIDIANKMYYNVLQKEVIIMAISLRLSNEESILVKSYAALHGLSVSDLFRQAVMEKIEDEYDLNAFEKAMASFKQDGTTYTLDEVEKELGLK